MNLICIIFYLKTFISKNNTNKKIFLTSNKSLEVFQMFILTIKKVSKKIFRIVIKLGLVVNPVK